MIHPIKTTFAAVALATTFGASAAMAGTIVIDDFTVEQQVRADGVVGETPYGTATGPLTSILGGVRFMQVATSPTGPVNGTSLEVEDGSGILTFDNGANQFGTGWLVYDGNTTIDRGDAALSIASVNGVALGAVVDTKGLNGADLLQGQLTGSFEFNVLNFDNDFGGLPIGTLTFSAFAWDMNDREVSYLEPIDPNNFSPILGYSQFSGDAGFDWGNLGALAFRIETKNQVALDGQLGIITATPIPLPASVLLLLGGVGGLAGLSAAAKRRRKA